MRKVIIVFLIMLISIPVVISQSIALAANGNQVLLNPDGTWAYILKDDQIVKSKNGDYILLKPNGSWVEISGSDVEWLNDVSAYISSNEKFQPNILKIGWFGPVTGDNALWGQSEFNTIRMVFDKYNNNGGINIAGTKYELELIGYDDKGDAIEAVNVVRRLTQIDHVVAILGPNGSGEAIPVVPIVNATKTPMIATVATNPNVTIREDGTLNKYVFRVCFIDPYQGSVAASYVFNKLGKKRAAVLFAADDAYSSGLTKAFEETFKKLGGSIVEKASFEWGEKNFYSQLVKIKNTNPDVIFSPNYYTDVSLSAKQARQMGIQCVFIGGDGWPSENLIPLAGTSLEGCYCVNHIDFQDPLIKPFKDEYIRKYRIEPELNAYLVYDAITMLVDSLQRANSLDGSKIAEALETCSINGITGYIKIGKESHNPEGKDAVILKIEDQIMKYVERYSIK